MKKFLKIISTFAPLIILGLLAYVFRGPLENTWVRLQAMYFPCAQPIAYSIGTFDTKFGLSKERFLGAIATAEAIWEKPLGKELFKYSPTGNLKINLIYDARQEATVTLKKLGLSVENDRASYDKVRIRYEALQKDFEQKKALYQSLLTTFNNDKKKYETEVQSWNARGGAPQKEVDRLNAARETLDQELAGINDLAAIMNAEVNDINALASVLNKLAGVLNLNVAKYNEVGQTRGREFEEGTYQSTANGQEINIYQYDTAQKLIRVLAHELGHALGLDHIDDPQAIMYRLNEGNKEKATASDLAALKGHCRIK